MLASFAYSNARQTAAGLHMGDLSKAVSDIPKEQGELKDVAVKLSEYIKNPQEEAQAIRGLLFAQYLGFSVASAFVNMTQPVTVTFPWLSQHGGAARAAKRNHPSGQAHRHPRAPLRGRSRRSAQGRRGRWRRESARGPSTDGAGARIGLAEGRRRHAGGECPGAGLEQRHPPVCGLGKLFSAAEQLNRRITFIAAYRVASQQRMANPAEFARRAVTETQFVHQRRARCNGAAAPWAAR